MYLREVVEEMGEDIERHGNEIDKITRNQHLMQGLVRQVFYALTKTYKETFMLEDFLRLMHETSKEDDSVLTLHETLLDAFDSLLSILGDLTALTADD